MAYSALAVSNYFINKSLEEKKSVTPMKLQKLVYYAHGWYLALTKKPLVNEDIQAWDYGPVIKSVFHEFKNFGRKPINSQAEEYFSKEPYSIPENDKDTIKLLDKIWELYSPLTAIQLSNSTHQVNSPWHNTYKNSEKGQVINESDIKKYFIGLRNAEKA